MKAAGTNTAHNTRAMAINAEPTSSMVRFAASRGARPAAMLRSTFSTTTIASSTTMPMARTKPNSDRLLSENPNIAMKKKVPISDTGIATIGMTAARQVCRKRMTTRTTRTIASTMVTVSASMDCWLNSVGCEMMVDSSLAENLFAYSSIMVWTDQHDY